VCVTFAAFVRKVYSILVCQLSVTVLFIALFLFMCVPYSMMPTVALCNSLFLKLIGPIGRVKTDFFIT